MNCVWRTSAPRCTNRCAWPPIRAPLDHARRGSFTSQPPACRTRTPAWQASSANGSHACIRHYAARAPNRSRPMSGVALRLLPGSEQCRHDPDWLQNDAHPIGKDDAATLKAIQVVDDAAFKCRRQIPDQNSYLAPNRTAPKWKFLSPGFVETGPVTRKIMGRGSQKRAAHASQLEE